MSADMVAREWARVAAAAAADKQADSLVAFDVSEVLVITDVFLVCTAHNAPQVAAVVDEIERRVKQAGASSVRREGQREGGWVLLDFIDLVVHVQLPESRILYDLERLWRDQPLVDLSDLPVAAG
jgi:ribosome-associated protein